MSHRSHAGVSASLETVVLVPVFLCALAICQAGYRWANAQQSLTDAAASAARAASLASDPRQGASVARRVIAASRPATCQGLTADLDLKALAHPPGSPGEIQVGLRCSVAWADLWLPTLGAAPVVTAQATEIIDQFAER